jgi:hypothetical protein
VLAINGTSFSLNLAKMIISPEPEPGRGQRARDGRFRRVGRSRR